MARISISPQAYFSALGSSIDGYAAFGPFSPGEVLSGLVFHGYRTPGGASGFSGIIAVGLAAFSSKPAATLASFLAGRVLLPGSHGVNGSPGTTVPIGCPGDGATQFPNYFPPTRIPVYWACDDTERWLLLNVQEVEGLNDVAFSVYFDLRAG